MLITKVFFQEFDDINAILCAHMGYDAVNRFSLDHSVVVTVSIQNLDIFQRPGVGFTLMFRQIPTVDRVGLYAKMYFVIPGDILNAGMGDHADKAAFFLLAADHIADPGEWIRDMGLDIVHPAPVFICLLLFREIPAPPAHFREAVVVAVADVIRQRYGFSRTILVENIAEEG